MLYQAGAEESPTQANPNQSYAIQSNPAQPVAGAGDISFKYTGTNPIQLKEQPEKEKSEKEKIEKGQLENE